MAKEEIKRFNEDVIKYQKLVSDIKDAGSDINKIVEIANCSGFNFTVEDINELKIKSEELKNSEPDDSLYIISCEIVVAVAVIAII